MFQTSDIPAQLNWLLEEAARWGPAAPVAIVFAVALPMAMFPPRRIWLRAAAAIVVVVTGVAAIGLLRWEQRVSQGKAAAQVAAAQSTQAAEISALHGLWAQWDALSKTLPPGKNQTAANFDTVDDALASLSAKVAAVGDQVAALKTGGTGRSIDPATAFKLTDYLHQYGNYRVVVSCVPGDLEAYNYANQLIGILRSAGWDASGPEATVNVTDREAMGIVVLMRDPTAPDAAKILLDAFKQANIPHQPGVSADNSIPDTATVELFVAKKP